jgi:hypothetical protein
MQVRTFPPANGATGKGRTGDSIVLKPAKDRSHLTAHLQFHRATLVGKSALGANSGTVGSGGVL